MKQKIQQLLNIVIGSSIGVLIGTLIYKYWHFHNYPKMYFGYSVPWYTGIIVQGIFTLLLIAVCLIGKAALMEKTGTRKRRTLISGVVFCFYH